MAEVELKVGAKLDLLNKGELDSSLMSAADAAAVARGAGLKLIRVRGGTIGNIGTTTAWPIAGPESGYVWSLRGLGVILSSAQTLQVYVGDNTTNVPANGLIAQLASATNQWTTWSNVQAFLNGGEYVQIAAGGSATAQYLLFALEAPAELAWKLA